MLPDGLSVTTDLKLEINTFNFTSFFVDIGYGLIRCVIFHMTLSMHL